MIRDNWIEDIDWVKVKQMEKKSNKSENLWDSDESEETVDVSEIYHSMLKLMHPGETVQKAIKRLGNQKTGGPHKVVRQFRRSAKSRKEQNETPADMDECGGTSAAAAAKSSSCVANPTENVDDSKKDLLALIGFADKLLSVGGEMEIYQETYEKLAMKAKNTSKPSRPAAAATETNNTAVDRGLDMFADDNSGAATSDRESKSQTAETSGTSNSGVLSY